MFDELFLYITDVGNKSFVYCICLYIQQVDKNGQLVMLRNLDMKSYSMREFVLCKDNTVITFTHG